MRGLANDYDSHIISGRQVKPFLPLTSAPSSLLPTLPLHRFPAFSLAGVPKSGHIAPSPHKPLTVARRSSPINVLWSASSSTCHNTQWTGLQPGTYRGRSHESRRREWQERMTGKQVSIMSWRMKAIWSCGHYCCLGKCRAGRGALLKAHMGLSQGWRGKGRLFLPLYILGVDAYV